MKKKKEYLKQYLLQQKKIIRLKEMSKLNPEKRKEFAKQIRECNKCRREIETKINAVDGGVLSELLFLKYACGKSLWQVSYLINYSRRQTERLHIKALEKFEL